MVKTAGGERKFKVYLDKGTFRVPDEFVGPKQYVLEVKCGNKKKSFEGLFPLDAGGRVKLPKQYRKCKKAEVHVLGRPALVWRSTNKQVYIYHKHIQQYGSAWMNVDYEDLESFVVPPVNGYIYINGETVNFSVIVVDIISSDKAVFPVEKDLIPTEFKLKAHRTWMKISNIIRLSAPLGTNDFKDIETKKPLSRALKGCQVVFDKEEFVRKVYADRVTIDALSIRKLQERVAISEEVVEEIITNIVAGRHLMLVGPPGTGKTLLATLIPKLLFNKDYMMITAQGGLDAVDAVYESIRKNMWLVIDEFNRCDMDKIFGEVITAMDTNELNVRQKRLTIHIPDDYRIIATMNSFDPFYKISYGLMRRFAFINVGVAPEEIERDFVTGTKGYAYSSLKRTFGMQGVEEVLSDPEFEEVVDKLYMIMDKRTGLRRIRDIGTAQILDVMRFVVAGKLMDSSRSYLELLDKGIETNILPHLKGVLKPGDKRIIKDIQKELEEWGEEE
jgi:hypothetical protein